MNLTNSEVSHSPDLPDQRTLLEWCSRSARFGWIVLSLTLVLQFLATRGNFLRDIEGLYPFSFDQGMYLMHAYDSFEALRNGGLSDFIRHSFLAPDRPTGVLVQAEAALAYGLFGASRTTSLMVLFLHFALLQVVLFATFRKLFSRNEIGFLAVGLLLTTSTRFHWAGGLNDFRLDLAASCLYGISLCTLVASDLFADLKWTVAFVGSLVLLFGSRFVSISFTMIGLTIVVGFILVREIRNKKLGHATGNVPVVRRAIAVCVATPVLAYPLMSSNILGLLNYYIIGHIVSPEKKLRAAEVGITNRWEAFFFYPKSLTIDHLGIVFFITATLALVGGVVIRLFAKRSASNSAAETVPLLRSAIFVSVVWLLAPLALFTADEAKSPVVAGMLAVPAVSVVLYLLLTILPGTWAGKNAGLSDLLRVTLGFAALLIGGGYTYLQQVRHLPNIERFRQADAIYRLYDAIAEDSRLGEVRSLKFATDRMLDYFNGTAAKVMIYERHGRLVDTQELLANGILSRSREEALAAIDAADYALITLYDPTIDRGGFPFNVSMLAYRKDLLERAESQMIPITRAQVGEHRFVVFSRPKLKLVGNSGEWLTKQGTTVRVETRSLQFGRYIVLSGPTMLSKYLKGKLECRAIANLVGKGPVELQTTSALGNDEYAIAIDTSNLSSDSTGTVEIDLDFLTYWVPQEVGLNVDTRKLAVPAPRSIRLLSGPSHYPVLLKAAAK